jgi:Amt family ammonium transporter
MGWFGFNAGSALTSGSDAAHALLNTHIAACASTVAFVISHKMIYKKHISVVAMLNGAVRPPRFNRHNHVLLNQVSKM